jgi:hypothetical protein
LTWKPAFLRFLIAEASCLPTTEGTRGYGAAITRATLDPRSSSSPSPTPCLRTVSFALLDGRRSMSPTARPAARSVRFASIRLSPLTAGTLASDGDGDGVSLGVAAGVLEVVGTGLGVAAGIAEVVGTESAGARKAIPNRRSDPTVTAVLTSVRVPLRSHSATSPTGRQSRSPGTIAN